MNDKNITFLIVHSATYLYIWIYKRSDSHIKYPLSSHMWTHTHACLKGKRKKSKNFLANARNFWNATEESLSIWFSFITLGKAMTKIKTKLLHVSFVVLNPDVTVWIRAVVEPKKGKLKKKHFERMTHSIYKMAMDPNSLSVVTMHARAHLFHFSTKLSLCHFVCIYCYRNRDINTAKLVV